MFETAPLVPANNGDQRNRASRRSEIANKLIDSPFDALWWGVTTLTTVGYGDTYPVTPEGRLAAMLLMLLGIGLFSAITASITSYLVSQDASAAQPEDLSVRLERLASLRREGSLTEDEFTAAKAAQLGIGER